jgi:hypothetical protein
MGVRGAFATSDIPAGGLVAAVPLRLTIRFPVPKTSEDLLVRRWGGATAAGMRPSHP